jgi:hypothetical protein
MIVKAIRIVPLFFALVGAQKLSNYTIFSAYFVFLPDICA